MSPDADEDELVKEEGKNVGAEKIESEEEVAKESLVTKELIHAYTDLSAP